MIKPILSFMKRAVGRETNQFGGIDPPTDYDLERSHAANLTTLPPSVKGTNCGNCLWIHDNGNNAHICTNSHLVNVPVNNRMCCIHWRNLEELRPWENEND